MATAAGDKAAWARSGTRHDETYRRTLVPVTHWTDADVAWDAELRQ